MKKSIYWISLFVYMVFTFSLIKILWDYIVNPDKDIHLMIPSLSFGLFVGVKYIQKNL